MGELASLNVRLRRMLTEVQLFALLLGIFDGVAVTSGFGRHADNLQHDQIVRAAKYLILGETAFIFSLGLSKVSICIFLYNLINRTLHKKKAYALYCTILLLSITTVACVAQQLAQCYPITKLWDPKTPGTCMGHSVQIHFGYLNGGTSDRSNGGSHR